MITDIACVIPRPDLQQLQLQVAAELSKRLLGGAPVLPMSAEDVLSFVMAGTVNLAHGFVTQALKENDPATMCCDNLVIYAAQHGLNIRSATRAKGYVMISGVFNTPIPAEMRFVSVTGHEYKSDPAVTFNPIVIDGTGTAQLRVVAALAGEEYNLPVNSVLTVATTYPGIDMDAITTSEIKGGTENETCEELRMRVLAWDRAGVISTNAAWYCRQIMSYPGVTRCCFDECDMCCDPLNITIYAFMEGVYGAANLPPLPPKETAPYGVPPGEVCDAITTWLFGPNGNGMGQGLAPIGVRGRVACALPTFVTIRAYCFHGCPTGTRDRVIAAVQVYIHETTCVGTTICKDQMKAVASIATGIKNCFAGMELAFDNTIAREDDAYAYLACGHFLVLADVIFTTDPPPKCHVYADQISILGDGSINDKLTVDLVDSGQY